MSKKTSGLVAGALLLAWAVPTTAEPGGPPFSPPALAAAIDALTARVQELEADNARLRNAAEILSGHVTYLLATDNLRERTLACFGDGLSADGILVMRGCDFHIMRDSSGAGGSLFVHDISAHDNRNLAVRASEGLVLLSGVSSMTMEKDGDITIKGKDIEIDGSGRIDIKANSDVTIKGSKIGEN